MGKADSATTWLGEAAAGAVAETMIAFDAAMGLPTTLLETEAYTDAHLGPAPAAIKNPQLKSKLESMPAPLTADTVDEHMGAVLRAARDGDLRLIKSV